MNEGEKLPEFDVAIVGAGPTGLTLANLLGLEGVSVLLLERNATTVGEPRAVSIDDESLRTMQAAKLIEPVLRRVVPGYGSRYLSPGGDCFLTVLPSAQPYGYPRRNAFRQPVLEGQLRDGLKRFDNVETRFGTVLSGFAQHGGGVDLTVSGGGRDEGVRASFLVGCDGASSPVRKALGVELEGETLPERWLIVDLADSPAERDTLVFCDYRRPCIALPGPDMTRRFEFKLFPDEDEAAFLVPANVEQLLASRGVAWGSRIVRQTVYTFHARLARRWVQGRVILAGDAAHLTPPFAGQGMNSGIRDAHNLAWKLAAITQGRLASTVLDTYEVERRQHVSGMIDLALQMGRIMGPRSRWRGWAVQTAFRAAGLWPPLRSYFAEMKYKPKPSFAEGFLLASSHPLVGRLIAQPMVRTPEGEERMLDDAIPSGFVLLGLDLSEDDVSDVAELFEFGSVPVVALALALGSDTSKACGGLSVVGAVDAGLLTASGTILLLRPDRYVMAAFTPEAAAAAAPEVQRLFWSGRPSPRAKRASSGGYERPRRRADAAFPSAA